MNVHAPERRNGIDNDIPVARRDQLADLRERVDCARGRLVMAERDDPGAGIILQRAFNSVEIERLVVRDLDFDQVLDNIAWPSG